MRCLSESDFKLCFSQNTAWADLLDGMNSENNGKCETDSCQTLM